MSSFLDLRYDSHQIRMVGTAERPEWVAQDVGDVLELANVRKVMADFDDDEKGVTIGDTPGGKQTLATVYEAGLYRLIFSSRKPEAKAFKKWIFGEVLPAIRKFGVYPPPAGPFVHPLTPRPWAVRFRETFGEHTRYVKRNFLAGAFTAVTGALNEYLTLEDNLLAHALEVQTSDRPDVSVGVRWSFFVRENGWESRRLGQAPLFLPNQGFPVPTYVYVPDLRGPFEYWLNHIYLPRHLPAYLRDKKEYRGHALPTASAANRTCVELTGEPAELPHDVRRQLEAANGFVPAVRGSTPPRLEG